MTIQIPKVAHSNLDRDREATARLVWAVRTAQWSRKRDSNKDRTRICHKLKVAGKTFTIIY